MDFLKPSNDCIEVASSTYCKVIYPTANQIEVIAVCLAVATIGLVALVLMAR